MVEGESINVCVVLMGVTDQPVEVALASQSNTAEGLIQLSLMEFQHSLSVMIHVLQRVQITRMCPPTSCSVGALRWRKSATLCQLWRTFL